MKKTPPIYFVMGTRAQFIKVAPIMRKMLDQCVPYILVYTAQHQENIEEILDIYKLPKPDMIMYDRGEANTRGAFLRWFILVLLRALFRAKRYLPEKGIVLTHGDTFTAWLAALMGKRAHCLVGHIESGCRSYNIFSPFPEEISRLITFSLSDYYFCADDWAIKNLSRYDGHKINMGANTMLDGVRYALDYPSRTKFDFEDSPFVMVSVHRFENIFTRRLTDFILPLLKEIAEEKLLIVTLHPTTRERLRSLGIFDEVNSHPHIILHERFSFVDWINLCNRAEYVITDGGSNQEELSYLGVPTLLLRNETERQEGLGKNVVVSKFDRNIIKEFRENLSKYRRVFAEIDARPSQVIIDTILRKTKEIG